MILSQARQAPTPSMPAQVMIQLLQALVMTMLSVVRAMIYLMTAQALIFMTVVRVVQIHLTLLMMAKRIHLSVVQALIH